MILIFVFSPHPFYFEAELLLWHGIASGTVHDTYIVGSRAHLVAFIV